MSDQPEHAIPGGPAREFYLAAESRRCAWYVALGMICCVALVVILWIADLHPRRVPVDTLLGITFICLSPAFVVLFANYHWRLRVDATGIARRRLWKWDVWTWHEFNTGAIERRGGTFVSKSRPWWRNELTLGYLDEEDRVFVEGVCKHFFRPVAKAEEPPAGEISLRYYPFRELTLREEGISGRTGRGSFDLDWTDVLEVGLLYYDHWSRELHGIELELPDRSLRVRFVSRVANATRGTERPRDGKLPDYVAAFLYRHVAPEKIERHAISGPPASLSDCERRRRDLKREVQTSTWLLRISLGSLALFLVWVGPRMLPLWQMATTFGEPLIAALLLRVYRNHHATALRKLDAWKDQYMERNASDQNPPVEAAAETCVA